jgi:hypothetical protein
LALHNVIPAEAGIHDGGSSLVCDDKPGRAPEIRPDRLMATARLVRMPLRRPYGDGASPGREGGRVAGAVVWHEGRDE